MLIKDLRIDDFRRFDKLEIDFHPELTVIVARNGQGKTTVLDAVTIALGTFIGAFDSGKAKHIEYADARYMRLPDSSESARQFPVMVEANFLKPELHVFRALTGPKNKTTIKDAHAITDYGKHLMQMVRDLKKEPLPVIAYYGAGRLWKVHKNVKKKQVLSLSRTLGYEECLSPSSNFAQVQSWMKLATLASFQQQELPREARGGDLKIRISTIANAVNQVLKGEGFSNFHYNILHEELAMYHPDHGILPVSYLSDGVRAMISLVADLAFRCVRLNGFLEDKAVTESQGIVLIDEVDIHLHPGWQQLVIQQLRDAFPKIQFIVTTHSPQLLTTVKRENIRLLVNNNSSRCEAEIPKEEIIGLESACALIDMMNVNPIPPVDEANWISEYTAKIENGTHEDKDGKDLRNKLLELYGSGHSVILDADKLIRFQKFKMRNQAAKD